MANNDLRTNEPRPRLCHLRRWPNFIGYGFNLHCEKKKTGQFIGKVDIDSPAESAGLRENDRIVEVNYVPIGNENHKQVVSRIKEGVTRNNTKYPDEVILLVVDPETDEFFTNKSIIVRSTDANVIKLETQPRYSTESPEDSPPLSNRSSNQDESTSSSRNSEVNGNYKHITDFTGPTVTQIKTESPTVSRNSDVDLDQHVINQIAMIRPSSSSTQHHHQPISPDSKASSTSTAGSSQTSPQSHNTADSLQFSMSAAEYREKLKAQNARKRDPRQEKSLSMMEKHKLIDGL